MEGIVNVAAALPHKDPILNPDITSDLNDQQKDTTELPPHAPPWLLNIIASTYFSFSNSYKRDKNTYFVLNCVLCKHNVLPPSNSKGRKLNRKHDSFMFQDKCAYSFLRHLERSHLNEYCAFNAKKLDAQSSVISSAVGTRTTDANQRVTYDKQHILQQRFAKAVLELIVLDSLPFNIVERLGFRNFVNTWDPKLQIPQRRSLVRTLDFKYKQVIEGLKHDLKGLTVGACHLILDIWSSKQKQSVIGFRAQYINKDWNMCSSILGFKHFPQSHTGENIRNMLEEFLSTTFNLMPYHFGSVTADNASNVLSAFKFTGIDLLPVEASVATEVTNEEFDVCDLVDDTALTVDLVTYVENEQPLQINEVQTAACDNDWEDDLQNDEGLGQALNEELLRWTTNSLIRNACLAHLTQLGVKDTFTLSKIAQIIIKKVNDIVNFFHKSNYWYSKLREKTGGTGLLKPCTTRWNSLFHCLKRIADIKRPMMIKHINAVLKEAKRDAPASKRDKIPATIHTRDRFAIITMLALLQPFEELTDALQSDSVTSSLVILGILNATKCASDVIIDEENEYSDELKLFQKVLCQSMKDRFATDKQKGERVLDATGKPRKIVTVEVFNNENYILAALLDPRIKTTPFDERTCTQSTFKDKIPKLMTVTTLLKTYYDIAILESETEVQMCVDASTSDRPRAVEDVNTPPPKKMKLAMFGLVENLKSSTIPPQKDRIDEVEAYIKLTTLEEQASPLLFWKQLESTYPYLSALAKKYLALPATSGCVERLFSIAGSIARSRRARLTVSNLEKLLCYQQSLIQKNK